MCAKVSVPQQDAAGTKRSAGNDQEIYRIKRDRNNIAVQKSRQKSRQLVKNTTEKMSILKTENAELERRLAELDEERAQLKRWLQVRTSGCGREDDSTSKTATQSSTAVNQPKYYADPQSVQKDHEYTVVLLTPR